MYVDLGPAAPIAAAIDQWRQTITKRTRPVMDDKDPAITLRKLVWQPLEPHLKDVKTVLVSPDGVLNQLPLGALPGSKPDRYLIEEVALVVIPVPQLIPEIVGDPKEWGGKVLEPSLLTIGNVDYGGAAGANEAVTSRGLAIIAAPGEQAQRPQWKRLDGTGPEAQAIRDAFAKRFPQGKTQLLLAGQATEAAFRQQAPQHRYLHLATHGFFADPKLRSALMPSEKFLEQQMFGREGFIGHNPGLLSGLVLAGANRPVQPDHDDGILTALEVAELDLRGTELAVLSACETGLGPVAGGEGVLGLQRAFQVAGARSTITSLWKVDDDATRRLMERFYANLWQKKLPKLEALREAQLWMLREGKHGTFDPKKGERVPPFYWAAFVLSGDWR